MAAVSSSRISCCLGAPLGTGTVSAPGGSAREAQRSSRAVCDVRLQLGEDQRLTHPGRLLCLLGVHHPEPVIVIYLVETLPSVSPEPHYGRARAVVDAVCSSLSARHVRQKRTLERSVKCGRDGGGRGQ